MTRVMVELASWPIAVMVAINLSRTIVDGRMAKVIRLGLLLALLGVVLARRGAS